MSEPKRTLFLAPPLGLGEPHTLLALALALRDAGHVPVFASSPALAAEARALGLTSIAVGSDFVQTDPSYWDTVFETLLDVHRGPRRWLEEHVQPVVESWLQACSTLAHEADLIVSGTSAPFASSLARAGGVPWLRVVRSPALMSAQPASELLDRLLPAHERSTGGLRSALDAVIERVTAESGGLLARVLARRGRGADSQVLSAVPSATFVAFSSQLMSAHDGAASPAPAGAPQYDGSGPDAQLDPALERFLQAGSAPVLLTLGSGPGVFRPGSLYDAFAEAIERNNDLRAVLLVDNSVAATLRPRFAGGRVFVGGYAPYGALMPRCRLLIHHGGAGPTAHALAAGVPSLVLGHTSYQRAHARRLVDLGVALSLAPGSLTADLLTQTLSRMLANPQLSVRAQTLAQLVRREAPKAAFVQTVSALLAASPARAAEGQAPESAARAMRALPIRDEPSL